MGDLKIAFSPTARAISAPDEIVVYADEQGSSNRSGGAEFAIGYAFAPVGLREDVIHAAVAARHSSADHKCLGDGYFHASNNCAACRNVLASAIRGAPGEIFFSTLRWRFARERPDHPHRGELHRHALVLALNHIAQSTGARRIRVRFARVKGLSEPSLRIRLDEDVDAKLRVMVGTGGMPTNFPDVIAEQVEPSAPGVQIADHLLWSEQRPTSECRTALDDLGFLLEYENASDGPFTIRHYVHGDVTLARQPHRPFPHFLGPESDLLLLFARIEKEVHQAARKRPDYLRHLERIVVPASRAARGRARLSDASFVNICRAFLLIVDTAPAYEVTSEEQSRAASDAAGLAAGVVVGSDTGVWSAADRWRGRREVIANGDQAAFLFDDD